jgi:uncharacterized membrane protein YkoI
VKSLILSSLLLAAHAAGEPARDHERARSAQRSGVFVPLERILLDVGRREPGTVIDVDLDGDEYEIEVLRDDGVVVELDYDARSGRFVESEIETEDD